MGGQKMCEEIWKAIAGFDGFYEVSSLGVVRSIERKVLRKDGRLTTVKAKLLSAAPDFYGYPRVSLRGDGKSHQQKVHRLVADAFLVAPPGIVGTTKNAFCINHKDGNKLNNCVKNLEWVRTSENYTHAMENGLICNKGSKNGQAKLTERDVIQVRREYANGTTQMDISHKYGVSRANISMVVNRRRFAHVD